MPHIIQNSNRLILHKNAFLSSLMGNWHSLPPCLSPSSPLPFPPSSLTYYQHFNQQIFNIMRQIHWKDNIYVPKTSYS